MCRGRDSNGAEAPQRKIFTFIDSDLLDVNLYFLFYGTLVFKGFSPSHSNKKTNSRRSLFIYVPREGLEPSRDCSQQILSLSRIPFRHHGSALPPTSGVSGHKLIFPKYGLALRSSALAERRRVEMRRVELLSNKFLKTHLQN